MGTFGKFRKKTLIEVVGITSEGYIVQNEGDSSDQWVIHPDLLGSTYEEVKEVKGETRPEPSMHLLFDALKVTNSNDCNDVDFRDKVKTKIEKILGL